MKALKFTSRSCIGKVANSKSSRRHRSSSIATKIKVGQSEVSAAQPACGALVDDLVAISSAVHAVQVCMPYGAMGQQVDLVVFQVALEVHTMNFPFRLPLAGLISVIDQHVLLLHQFSF